MTRELCPFGAKLFLEVEKYGLTLKALAKHLGYSRSYLYHLSYGDGRVTEVLAICLEQVFLSIKAEDWLLLNLHYQLEKARGHGPKRTDRGTGKRQGSDEGLSLT